MKTPAPDPSSHPDAVPVEDSPADPALARLCEAEPSLATYYDPAKRLLRLEFPVRDSNGAPMLAELEWPARVRPSHVAAFPFGRGLDFGLLFQVASTMVGQPLSLLNRLEEGDVGRVAALATYFLQRSRVIGG